MELKVFLWFIAIVVGVFCVWAVFDFMRGKYATNDMFMELDKGFDASNGRRLNSRCVQSWT